MKAIKQALVEKYFGRHLDLRVRLFNTLAMGGILISLAMASVTPFTGAGFNHFLVNILLAAVSFGLLYFSRKTGNYQLCYLITVVCIFMILFPVAFFVSDGYRGGMPTFFVFAGHLFTRGRTAFVVTRRTSHLRWAHVFACTTKASAYASEDGLTICVSFVVVSITWGYHTTVRMNFGSR